MYRFTGASPELLTDSLPDYVPGVDFQFLSTNYRSTQTIIGTSNTLIAHNYDGKGGPYSQGFMKDTQSRDGAPEGDPIKFTMCGTVFDEAQQVADTLVELMATRDYQFGDFYVGSRTRAQLGYLEGILYRAGVKFVNIAGGSFWENKHVANIIAYLRLAHDTADDEAFKRVYNKASVWHTDRKGDYCHHRWLGREFMELTGGRFSNMEKAVQRNKRYYYGVTDFREFIDSLQAEMEFTDDVAHIIQYIWENCYREWLKAMGDRIDEDADANVLDDYATILEVAAQYTSVEAFLNYVAEMIYVAEEAKKGDLDDYAVLSTYHRLKGSERPVVFGLGWCEGQDPKTEQPRGLLPHTFSLTPPPVFGVLPTGGAGSIADERCIAFVCVTRAKDLVYLSGCTEYRGWILNPSRFVYEMGLEIDFPERPESQPVDEEVETEA
jgi:DNA helicase-2/ATP-dependent DNA helicase PcrA